MTRWLILDIVYYKIFNIYIKHQIYIYYCSTVVIIFLVTFDYYIWPVMFADHRNVWTRKNMNVVQEVQDWRGAFFFSKKERVGRIENRLESWKSVKRKSKKSIVLLKQIIWVVNLSYLSCLIICYLINIIYILSLYYLLFCLWIYTNNRIIHT